MEAQEAVQVEEELEEVQVAVLEEVQVAEPLLLLLLRSFRIPGSPTRWTSGAFYRRFGISGKPYSKDTFRLKRISRDRAGCLPGC